MLKSKVVFSLMFLFVMIALSSTPNRAIVSLSGIVIDSITEEPVENAVVIMTQLTNEIIQNLTDTVAIMLFFQTADFDSAVTDKDGAYALDVTVEGEPNALFGHAIGYAIFSAEHDTFCNFALSKSSTIAVDTAKLVKPGQSFLTPKYVQSTNNQQATHIALFSLSGRELYRGDIVSKNVIRTVLAQYNQPLIIRYMNKEEVISEAFWVDMR